MLTTSEQNDNFVLVGKLFCDGPPDNAKNRNPIYSSFFGKTKIFACAKDSLLLTQKIVFWKLARTGANPIRKCFSYDYF